MANIVQVQVRQVGPATSEGAAREHRVLIDRPPQKGGADRGPMGGELLLLSLGGCFLSNLLAAVRAREAPLSNLRTQITGTLQGSPARYTAVEMQVAADGGDRAVLQKLVTITERSCIVANTLRAAADLSVRVADERSTQNRTGNGHGIGSSRAALFCATQARTGTAWVPARAATR